MKKGFTLIEILIVVAIIAILASVVIVGLGPTQQAGRDARRLADLHTIQNAFAIYYNKCGYYPGDWTTNSNPCTQTLPSAGSWPTSAAGSSIYGTIAKDIINNTTNGTLGINTMPQDPTNGHTYMYAVDSARTTYVVWAKLESANNSAFNGYNAPTPPSGGDSVTCSNSGGSANYCLTL